MCESLWAFYRAQNNQLQEAANISAAARRTQNAQTQNNANATQTAMAQSNAANTAVAQAQVDATSTAVAEAQAKATAAFIADHPYPSYLAGHGTLALYDSLSQSQYWAEGKDDSFGGSCQFKDDSFHILQAQTAKNFSCNEGQTFGNFAFEVQMKIIQGDCGGITFRASQDNSKNYVFDVCQDRTYQLIKYVGYNGSDATTQPAPSSDNSAINAGLNQVNTIAVTAQDQTINLYINGQQINSVQEDSYKDGYIGLIANAINNQTEVVYNHATVWKF